MPGDDLFGRDRVLRIAELDVVDLVEELPHTDRRTVTPACDDIAQAVHVAAGLRLPGEKRPVGMHGTLSHAEHRVYPQPFAKPDEMVETGDGAGIIVCIGCLVAYVVEMVLLVDREIEPAHPNANKITAVAGEERQHVVVVIFVVLFVQGLEKARIVVGTRFPADVFSNTPERRSVVVNQRPVIAHMQNTPGIRGRADIEVYGFRAGGFTALFAQAEAAGIASLFLRRETGFPARLGTRRPLDPVTRQHPFGARRRGNQHVESNLLLQIGIVVTGRQADREIGTLVKAGPGRSAFHGTDLRPYPGRGEEYKEDQNGFFHRSS